MGSKYMPPAMRKAAINKLLFRWDDGRMHRAATEQDEKLNDTTTTTARLAASSAERVAQHIPQAPTTTKTTAAAMLPALPASVKQQSNQWAQFPRVAALLQRLSRDTRLKNHTPLALLNEYAAKERIELSYETAADISCGYRVTSRMKLPQRPLKLIEGVGRGRSKAAAKQECAVSTLQTVLEVLPDGEFLKWHLKDIPDYENYDDGAQVNSMDNVLSALRASTHQADGKMGQESSWRHNVLLRDSDAVDADPKTWSDCPYVAALMKNLQVNPRNKDKTPLALLHEYVAKNHQEVDYSTAEDSAVGPYTVTATIGSNGGFDTVVSITGVGRGRNKVKAKQAAAAAALEQLLTQVPSSAEELLSKTVSNKMQKYIDRVVNAHTGLGFARDGGHINSHRSDMNSWRGRSQSMPKFVSPRFEPRFLYKADIDQAGTFASKTQQQDYSSYTYNQHHASGAGLGFNDAAAVDTTYHQPAQQQQQLQYYYSDPASASYNQQYASVAQDMAAWPALGYMPPLLPTPLSGQQYSTTTPAVQQAQQQLPGYQYSYQYQYK